MKDVAICMFCFYFVTLTVLLVQFPEAIGKWQAQVELAFVEEAERIGLWSE